MKAVLITGATSGIGYEFAKIFASKNHNLLLIARNTKDLKRVQNELTLKSNKVHTYSVDLSDQSSADKIYKFCRLKKLDIDILINNAGIGDVGNFWEENTDKLWAMMNINMVSLTKLTRLFLPSMVAKKQGKILNMSSIAAFEPGPHMAVYYASKAYVLSLTEALAKELEETGIVVTALCPGPTKTNFHKKAGSFGARLLSLKRPAEPSDVARFGYRALMSGRVVAIHGTVNKILVHGSKFVPEQIMAVITSKLHQK